MFRNMPGRRTTTAARVSPAVAVERLENRQLMSTVVALTGSTLLFVDSAAPDVTLAKLKVKGLQKKETLLGIDFRPATGRLYGVGSTSRLYQIDLTSGLATAVNTSGELFEPGLGTAKAIGTDFDPRTDLLRITTDNDVNLRIDPTNGLTVDSDTTTTATQPDTGLAYLAGDTGAGLDPTITGIAYDNNTLTTNTAATTTLFGIDTGLNTLVTVGSNDGIPNSPDTGRLQTVGSLGVDPVSVAGFDIETVGTTDTGYAALATADRGPSSLYTINLTTGTASPLGQFKVKGAVTDIAVVPAGSSVLAVDAKNRLYRFGSTLPTLANRPVKITGLAKGEKVLSVDVRPATGGLYAYTNQNRLYTLDATSGAAVSVGTPTSNIKLAKKAKVDIDFNPVVDALRVVTSTGQNFRIDPGTGAVIDGDATAADTQGDTNLVFSGGSATPSVTGIAYSNDIAGGFGTPAATVLYGIDTGTGSLVTIGSADGATSPNTGQVFNVGTLGLALKDVGGFDIVTASTVNGTTPGFTSATNAAFATLRESKGGYGLYSIDLTNGTATKVASLGKGVAPVGIAALPTAAVVTPPIDNGGTGTGAGTDGN